MDQATTLGLPERGGVYALSGVPGYVKIGRATNIRRRRETGNHGRNQTPHDGALTRSADGLGSEQMSNDFTPSLAYTAADSFRVSPFHGCYPRSNRGGDASQRSEIKTESGGAAESAEGAETSGTTGGTNSSNGERWLPVVGFPKYEVSDRGRVRSLWFAAPRLMKLRRHLAYWQASMQRPDGKNASKSVHVLVLAAFVRPREPWEQCRHLDGDGGNNLLSNLAWGTAKQNNADKVIHGTLPYGDAVPNSKLRSDDIRWLRWAIDYAGVTRVAIARAYGATHTAVNCAVAGLTWRHAPGNDNARLASRREARS